MSAPPSPGDGIHLLNMNLLLSASGHPRAKPTEAGKGTDAPVLERGLLSWYRRPGLRTDVANTTPALESYGLGLTLQLCHLRVTHSGKCLCLYVSPPL